MDSRAFGPRPPLASRPPANRAIAATLRLWQDFGYTELTTLQRIAATLREPESYPHRLRGQISDTQEDRNRGDIGVRPDAEELDG
jgi:hypothetical protein